MPRPTALVTRPPTVVPAAVDDSAEVAVSGDLSSTKVRAAVERGSVVLTCSTSGFYPGKDLEWRGMIRYGAQMAFAYARARVPRVLCHCPKHPPLL